MEQNRPFVSRLGFRPTATKYTDFKIPDPLVAETTNQLVDLESQLRNQTMALQRDSQATYVPTSQSELYHNPMQYTKEYTSYTPSADYKIPLCKTLDPNLFHNSTRYYLKKEI